MSNQLEHVASVFFFSLELELSRAAPPKTEMLQIPGSIFDHCRKNSAAITLAGTCIRYHTFATVLLTSTDTPGLRVLSQLEVTFLFSSN